MTKAYRKELIIVFIQIFMFYIFPIFADPGDEMGLVAVLLATTFILGILMGSISDKKLKYAFPIFAAILFLPTVPIHYNASAMIHAVWYFVISAAGFIIGALISFFMKLTFKKKILVVCLILGFILIGGIWCMGFRDTYLGDLSQETGINISWGDIVSEADSHGGFHGDGTKITVLHFTDSSFESEMEENEKWHALPLPEELETVVYGRTEANSTAGPFIGYNSVDMEIPEITNGYYYFKDRHSESGDPYDSSQILERHSYNFTILIYDCETDLMYICKEDT